MGDVFIDSAWQGLKAVLSTGLPVLAGVLVFAVIVWVLREIWDYFWYFRGYKQSEYYQQTRCGYWKLRFDKGRTGEYLTYKELKKTDGYKRFLFNCYVPKADGTDTEVDVLMLHESGIYVLESKNYSGWIFGTETQKMWTQSLGKGRNRKSQFLNPIIQNKGHIKCLRAYLEDYREPIFYSYIVFSLRCELKKVQLKSEEHIVIKRDKVSQMVSANAKRAGKILSQDEIDALFERLFPLTQADEETKKAHIQHIEQKYKHGKAKPTAAGEQRSEQAAAEVTIAGEQKLEQAAAESVIAGEQNEGATYICPRCGAAMVLRIAKRGENAGKQFYGCSNYPKCRYIQNIE